MRAFEAVLAELEGLVGPTLDERLEGTPVTIDSVPNTDPASRFTVGLGERGTAGLPWDNVVCDALYPKRDGGAELVLLLALLDGILLVALCIVRTGLFGGLL